MPKDRIRLPALEARIVSAEDAATHIKDGMTVGMSGFTRAGEAKALPRALAARAAQDPFKISLLTGASLGNDLDKKMAEAHLLARRLPFQADAGLRKAINSGEVMFIDQHLSETSEFLRSHSMPKVDVAIVEAVAINPDGGIVPTASVGNSAIFVTQAEKVIVEINIAQPLAFEGMHDVYLPSARPGRGPIPLTQVDQRIGTPFIPCDPDRIVAVVITDELDSPSTVVPPDADTQAIANHLIAFLEKEVQAGRLSHILPPLQAGIGSVANAVLHGFIASQFHNLTMYSEVLQDSTFDLLDSGKMTFASACSIALSGPAYQRFIEKLDFYKERMVLRPQEISNHPELIRRQGLICINTALECDIYGNVNSTHVGGTHMMNGIGGSGDFARNGHLAVFVTKSIAKDGKISSIVPMVPHVDHIEHDVDIIATEIGLADLRNTAPRERPRIIIDNCVHPDYRDELNDYVERAWKRGGQTPHVLEEALSWHTRLRETGTMHKKVKADA